MSYLKKFEYNIKPLESYPILRNCSLCGCKSIFVNSNRFRINANGNRIDVWLIYQCNKCKHTYNMTIYERTKAGTLPPKELALFMDNNEELARHYGTDLSFFSKNKSEIDWDHVQYELVSVPPSNSTMEEQFLFQAGNLFQIKNTYGIKIREDKIISEVLHLSRNQVKKLKEAKRIEITKAHSILFIKIL